MGLISYSVVLLVTRLQKLSKDKHFNLLGLFGSYEENKVLWIWLQIILFKTEKKLLQLLSKSKYKKYYYKDRESNPLNN